MGYYIMLGKSPISSKSKKHFQNFVRFRTGGCVRVEKCRPQGVGFRMLGFDMSSSN